MSFILGQIVGGVLAMVLFSWIISLFAYKSKEPIPRAMATVMTAWLFGTALYGYNTGNFLLAAMVYGLGAIPAFFERKRHFEKHWVSDTDLIDTFK